jgi:glycosyltransferase involved in cell wall biosynthesis
MAPTALYLTPIYPPSTGGASSYFGGLVNKLAQAGAISRGIVLTEYVNDRPFTEETKNVVVYRLMIPRFGRHKNSKVYDVLFFIINQIILALLIPYICVGYNIDLIQYHSSFGNVKVKYNNYIFKVITRICARAVVCDIRDAYSVPRKDTFIDGSIYCAKRIGEVVSLREGLADALHSYIPVPFDPPTPVSVSRVREVKQRHNVSGEYIIFVGDISEAKGAFLTIDSFKRFNDGQKQKCALLMIGKNRSGKWDLRKRIRSTDSIRYLGPLNQDLLFPLMQGAELLILPSKSEGMPRVCLEAIALGTPILCPEMITEFNETIPECTIHSRTPSAIARQIERLINSREDCLYDLSVHEFENLIPRYRRLYASLTR